MVALIGYDDDNDDDDDDVDDVWSGLVFIEIDREGLCVGLVDWEREVGSGLGAMDLAFHEKATALGGTVLRIPSCEKVNNDDEVEDVVVEA